MSGSLDTNVLVRLTLGDLPEQSAAIERLLEVGDVFVVSESAIFEMVYVLEKIYHFSREDVSKSVLAIVRNKKFSCNTKFITLVIAEYVKETRLSIIDCALQLHAQNNNCTPLFTFDIALSKAYPNTVSIPK
jgi:predicted nucleic-acid-binding protein